MKNGLNLITYACIDLQVSILAILSPPKTFGLTKHCFQAQWSLNKAKF